MEVGSTDVHAPACALVQVEAAKDRAILAILKDQIAGDVYTKIADPSEGLG